MASYGGVSTSTSLGRPFLSGHSPEQPGLGPMGQPQQQWSRAIPQGVQLPYTQGTSEIPMERPLTGVFKGASPQELRSDVMALCRAIKWNRRS